jgi:hypothetical protein
MHSTWRIVKAGTAVGVSLWIAVVACVMGCALPAITGSRVSAAANHRHTRLMADMQGCLHSSGNPGAPEGKKPVPNGAVSCCPVETTLTPKWDPEATRAAVARHFVPPANFDFIDRGFSSFAGFNPSLWHTGREKLLEMHLLRI